MPQDVASKAPPMTPQQHVLGIMLGFWQSRALAIAIELDVAECLSAGPLPVDVLASRTSTDAVEPLSSHAQHSKVCRSSVRSRHACSPTRQPASVCAKTFRLAMGYSPNSPLNRRRPVRGLGRTSRQHPERPECVRQAVRLCVWEFFRRNPALRAIFDESQRSLAAAATPAVTASYECGSVSGDR